MLPRDRAEKQARCLVGQKDELTDNTRFFNSVINIKAPYFFCVGFKMEGDAAAFFHFLLLNKKCLF